MSKNSLFKFKDVKNRPSRNGFDLSKRLLFTAKVGELLPIYNKRVMPGDKFSIDLQSFTRTQPLNSAAYTRVKEYFDFFFVPYRLLWRNAHQSFTMMTNNNVAATSPTTPLVSSSKVPHIKLDDLTNLQDALESRTNIFGFSRGQCSRKLTDYLRYTNYFNSGDFEQDRLEGATANLFPVLAYNKIYYDFFRYAQWEQNKPQCYNVDYMTSSTNLYDYVGNPTDFVYSDNMFDLKYCNFGKDLFIGLLPNSQYGEEAFVSADADGSVILPAGTIKLDQNTDILKNSNGRVLADSIGLETATGTAFAFTSDVVNDYLKLNPNATNADVISATTQNLISKVSVLQIRNAVALQKWREIAQSGDPTYREQVQKHFGVTLPQALGNLCTYIGGTQGVISINEVVNNNLSSDDSQANIFGKGVGTVNGSKMQFDVKEHGLIMCIYHATPLVDYNLTGLSRELQSVEITDYAIPEFDKLGFEPVALNEFFNPSDFGPASYPNININTMIGYAPRYYSYKTDLDEVLGAFRTTLPNWVAQFDSKYLSEFVKGFSIYTAFKVNPHILDDIFNVNCDDSVDTDQLLVGVNFDIMAVRNLDYNGLPY